MVFSPEEPPEAAKSPIEDAAGAEWVEMYRHSCTFGPDIFIKKMMYLIQNPNINTTWLFRADIIYDDHMQTRVDPASDKARPRVREVMGVERQRTLVRTLVPRNTQRDAPLDQTCTFYQSQQCNDGLLKSLVLYIPHADSPSGMPFYHPKVKGIAHLHVWDPQSSMGTISVHFLPFPGDSLQNNKIQRTAYHLLEVICKHGEDADYVKKVAHDVVVPQATFQNCYTLLKTKYARSLIDSWAEQTDPQKHVFEDLGIAAFLIELWAEMYRGVVFPGFVDIGCGNGLLVHILNEEGYAGWGFDARSRTSWKNYQGDQPSAPNGKALEQRLLVPYMIPNETCSPNAETIPSASTHDGRFPPGTFIISNHADELTPWTPILAAGSGCPFIMIPCCSHDLSGAKYRAPPPKDKSKGISTYASLVEWVSCIAADCGFLVETEMLRIPSTRNTGLLGRSTIPTQPVVKDILAIIQKYGGTGAYRDTVARLVKTGPGGH